MTAINRTIGYNPIAALAVTPLRDLPSNEFDWRDLQQFTERATGAACAVESETVGSTPATVQYGQR